jgi:hypothetical protein
MEQRNIGVFVRIYSVNKNSKKSNTPTSTSTSTSNPSPTFSNRPSSEKK